MTRVKVSMDDSNWLLQGYQSVIKTYIVNKNWLLLYSCSACSQLLIATLWFIEWEEKHSEAVMWVVDECKLD